MKDTSTEQPMLAWTGFDVDERLEKLRSYVHYCQAQHVDELFRAASAGRAVAAVATQPA